MLVHQFLFSKTQPFFNLSYFSSGFGPMANTFSSDPFPETEIIEALKELGKFYHFDRDWLLSL